MKPCSEACLEKVDKPFNAGSGWHHKSCPHNPKNPLYVRDSR